MTVGLISRVGRVGCQVKMDLQVPRPAPSAFASFLSAAGIGVQTYWYVAGNLSLEVNEDRKA